MKTRLILLQFIFLITIKVAFSQDSVSFDSRTKVVLDHFSELFKDQTKVIEVFSFFDNKGFHYYNINIVYELSLALDPQPMFYYKYRNLILVYQNYFYTIKHSPEYLKQYINEVKLYTLNDIEIDSIEPLKTHRIKDAETIICGKGAILYYCYKVEDNRIINFEKTWEPFKNDCTIPHTNR